MEFNHTPVMLNECIDGLNIKKDGIGVYVDGTLGGAGHSKCIAQRLSEAGKLICIDRDERALEYSRNVLSAYNSCVFVHGNFSNLLNILDKLNINLVDGVLLDLGVSSYQLDTPERGFSYMHDAPLDMRMDKSEKFNAFDIVNSYSADRLNNIIFNYGEERWAKRIAEYIVKQRSEKPIETTFELVSAIKSAIPKKARLDGPHPAKRTFQAIRIEVNGELEILSKAIHDIAVGLKQGGRICVITFHSLEDRIIKNVFKELENPCSCPREFPVCMCGKKPSLRVISRKPILPSEQELSVNHRSRSAKLRIAEKL